MVTAYDGQVANPMPAWAQVEAAVAVLQVLPESHTVPGVVPVNGSAETEADCALPMVALPAPLKCSTVPAGRVFADRYSLTAQPEAAPVASSTSSFGLVPPLHVVAVPETAQPDSVVADPLAHWS